MPYCTKCGCEIKVGTNFCPYCGWRIVQLRRESPISQVPHLTPVPRSEKLTKVVAGIATVIVLAIVLVIVLPFVEQGGGRLSPKNEIERELAKVPSGYYFTNEFQTHANTSGELEVFLLREFSLPTGYQEEVFDCSESSAYLEWALEVAGFNASIIVGPTPWDPKLGHHAWVIVHASDHAVAIEPTVLTGGIVKRLWDELKYLFTGEAPGVVYYTGDYTSKNYYHSHTDLYCDIYDAIRKTGNAREWNWWEGYWGFV